MAARRAPSRLLSLRVSPIHGLGVFAAGPIRAGTRLIEYAGERITRARADARCEDDPTDRAFSFMFTLDGRLVIDAARDGNMARFINHSCEPNCESTIEDHRVYIEAQSDIRRGEELTYDYHLTTNGPRGRNWRTEYACYCRSPNCRGSLLEADENGPIPRRLPARPATPPAPGARERAERFPSEFAELLSEAGLGVLCTGPRTPTLRHKSAAPILLLPDVLATTRLASPLALLEGAFRKHLRPLHVPIADATGRRAKRGRRESMPPTQRVLGADLNGRRSPALQAAQAIGLHDMLHSQTFRNFAEAVSGQRLHNEWDCQVLCYESGGYLGPHRDHLPRRKARREARIDLHVTLCNEGVQTQWLVYERDRYLTGSVRLGGRPAVIACRLPCWHYTTPLLPRPGREREARRWVLRGSFRIAEG